MKKCIAVLMTLCLFVSMQAQTNPQSKPAAVKDTKTTTPAKEPAKKYIGAEISFDKLTHNFGTLKIGEVKEGLFTFTNVGVKPLIIESAVASCDCTEMTFPKTPIMPGQTGVIKATYTAKTAGSINKRITVTSTAETDRVILQIKGDVVE
ncbi:MAG: DUF1573 domain-containing protein [Bacteroidales bacterium]|jgi:hypothetical protein|nr:DUF1573 domain-containing protein [Bacteroidales bacterium]